MKKINPIITRLVAGALTAVISPFAALAMSGNVGQLTDSVAAGIAAFREPGEDEPSLPADYSRPVNNGNLMLYIPQQPDDLAKPAPPDPDEESTATATGKPPSEIPPGGYLPPEAAVYVPVISRNITAEPEDLSGFAGNGVTIVSRTFRRVENSQHIDLPGGGQVRNATRIDNAVLAAESLLPLTFELQAQSAEPQVLIYHTHTTESFRPGNALSASADYGFRTRDSRQSIVAVGAAISEQLAAAGFGVIHDGTIHDAPNFTGAYRRSRAAVQAILAEYPSIKIVLDVHRDAITASTGEPTAPRIETGGKKAAQIMLISPADNGEWGVPDFLENFRFASRLQSQLEQDNPGITRPILFQYCNYNLFVSPGALLVEVGGHGNSLAEAVYSGELFGQSLARLLHKVVDNAT